MKPILQTKLDIEKWLDSEVRHADQCGHYAYCAYCENHAEFPCAEAWLKMQAVKVQQTAASESAATVTKRKVKTFTDRLAEISIDLAEAYVIIDEKLTERGLMSRRSATTQSYSVARKAYAKLVLTAREMRLFVALKPTEASALCPAAQDVSQKKAYRSTPVMLALRTYEDVRNAVALINALNV